MAGTAMAFLKETDCQQSCKLLKLFLTVKIIADFQGRFRITRHYHVKILNLWSVYRTHKVCIEFM